MSFFSFVGRNYKDFFSLYRAKYKLLGCPLKRESFSFIMIERNSLESKDMSSASVADQSDSVCVLC